MVLPHSRIHKSFAAKVRVNPRTKTVFVGRLRANLRTKGVFVGRIGVNLGKIVLIFGMIMPIFNGVEEGPQEVRLGMDTDVELTRVVATFFGCGVGNYPSAEIRRVEARFGLGVARRYEHLLEQMIGDIDSVKVSSFDLNEGADQVESEIKAKYPTLGTEAIKAVGNCWAFHNR
jgi:hypothetical protein